MLAIIISKLEPFETGARIIADDCKSVSLSAKILFLEDIILGSNAIELLDGVKILYFLTNDSSLERYVEYFVRKNILVINKDFYRWNRSKFSIQDRLKLAGIQIPRSIATQNFSILLSESRFLDFPLYIKSQNQSSLVIKVADEEALRRALSDITQRNDFYLEQSVDAECGSVTKYYFVDRLSCGINGDLSPPIISSVLKSISTILSLDVFSVDLFVGDDKKSYWCIDVNPAPGLFNSKHGRSEFIKYAQRLDHHL
ncbi:MAG: hypothetical protein AAB482_00095 [Patescibacteria group bacterium]